jgi:hypothetical protein
MSVESLLYRQSLAKSRRKTEKKRVNPRKYVKGRPRGRPIKQSGIYYTRQVLITDRLMLKIQRARLPGEPLGSTLERLVNEAEQKKVEAPLLIEASTSNTTSNDITPEFIKQQAEKVRRKYQK